MHEKAISTDDDQKLVEAQKHLRVLCGMQRDHVFTHDVPTGGTR